MVAETDNQVRLSRPRVVPVIMSGGSGTRLWPLSTPERPKQFHAFNSDASMIQETAARTWGEGPVEFLPPLVVCADRHCDLVQDHMAEAGIAPSAVVLEPVPRNTAPVAVIAAKLAAEMHPGALVLLVAADHVIADRDGFVAAVARSAETARDYIVTFGITPSRPETGYGYIQCGEPLAEGVFKVARFAEKPARAVAEAYLAEGGYSWNAGIFLFAPDTMLAEMANTRPDILEAALDALAASPRSDKGVIALDPVRFAACPSESIDYAVMEKTQVAAVAPGEFGWADIGSWSELWRLGPHDADGNRLRGDVLALDSRGSLVWSDGPTVAVLGLEDMVVVATGDAVVVAPKARAQEVKDLLARLKDR
jgi:mannose-1-phosphate guanylyltransferase/mannose-6-phosphate isomerase